MLVLNNISIFNFKQW